MQLGVAPMVDPNQRNTLKTDKATDVAYKTKDEEVEEEKKIEEHSTATTATATATAAQ